LRRGLRGVDVRIGDDHSDGAVGVLQDPETDFVINQFRPELYT
jgi:hypothetical protein